MHEQQLHPFHYRKVQALLPADYESRLNMCANIQNLHNTDENFLSKILVTDEAGFGHEGPINLHNLHYWNDENPHAIIERGFQDRFSLNVWAGIVEDHLIGPHFLPNRLSGEMYLNFLRNHLPLLLEDVPLQVRNSMWLLQDGAPPHFSIEVREYLNEHFPNRWIGRRGFVEWAARSPDLNPMDFFFWSDLKTLVYKTPVNTLEQLRQRIIESCETIRQKQGIFFKVHQSFLRRLNLCVEMEGQHFEHLL